MQRNVITAEVAEFDKSRLKPATTRITNADGKVCLESGPSNDVRTTEFLTEGAAGYVVDVLADLQVGEILPGLILGSQDIAHDIDLLTRYKVTHILNVATGVPNIYPELCAYKNIVLLDDPSTQILNKFDIAFQFINEGRKNGCCLVHCNAGISRAATIVIAYVMKTECKSFQWAFSHVKSRRPAICPNPGFMAQLEHYEKVLLKKT